jgi:hypothetical protein
MDARAIVSGLLIIVALGSVDVAIAEVKIGAVVGAVKRTPSKGTTTEEVKAGVVCNQGDLLEPVNGTARVVLQCSSEGTHVLDGRFRAVILSTAPDVCAINLRQGKAIATTPPDSDEACEPTVIPKTRIEVSSAVLGACGTRFGVEVSQARLKAAYVVEGAAVLSSAGRGGEIIKTGFELRPDENRVMAIPDARLRSLATTYAALSRSEAGTPISPDKQKQLQASYYAAFREPGNPIKRAAVIETQRAAGVRGVAQKYDFERASQLVKTSNNASLQSRWSTLNHAKVAIVTKLFENPRHNGYRVDICRTWGQECNQPAADQWCQIRGYTAAASFAVDADIGANDPSINIESGEVCSESFCDAFSSIACRGPPKQASFVFPNPKHMGTRLDICLHWGANCGQPAANAWCALQGFERSDEFHFDVNVGGTTPTIVMGDAKTCTLPECDAFASITCTR